MNKNDFEGKWKFIRDQSKTWWDLLTEDDLVKVDNAKIKYFEYVTRLQLRYELDRQVVKDEIDKRVAEYETAQRSRTVMSFIDRSKLSQPKFFRLIPINANIKLESFYRRSKEDQI
ncbi:MAG: hypothetical protein IPP66_07385 [Anaerolineales bacterium]|nr:hypothetical protein [Anaerolineales bacterium]